MAFERQFAAAYIDGGTRHRILGIRLRPFCLWHLLLLQVVESPFICKGEATLFDLKTAIGICRLRFGQSNIRRPMFPVYLRYKGLEKSVLSFVDYIGDYLSKPEYTIIPLNTGQSRKPSAPRPRSNPAPEVVVVAYDAARGAGVSVHEAWEMPIGQAYISQAMHLRETGAQVDFLTDEESEFQRQLIAAGIR